MKCNDITQQMSEALDGLLDAKQQAAFDAHLAACPACREGFDALRETVAQLHDLPAVTPPADHSEGGRARSSSVLAWWRSLPPSF